MVPIYPEDEARLAAGNCEGCLDLKAACCPEPLRLLGGIRLLGGFRGTLRAHSLKGVCVLDQSSDLE